MTANRNYGILKTELNAIQWRHFLASEAMRIGHRGIQQVMQKSGVSVLTIKRGIRELTAGELYEPGERVREKGGWRKKLAAC
jgi:hypothetical protein